MKTYSHFGLGAIYFTSENVKKDFESRKCKETNGKRCQLQKRQLTKEFYFGVLTCDKSI